MFAIFVPFSSNIVHSIAELILLQAFRICTLLFFLSER